MRLLGAAVPTRRALALSSLLLLTLIVPLHGHADAQESPFGNVRLERAFSGRTFDRPVFLTHAGDGTGMLYVVEQAGVIGIVKPSDFGARRTFLDIRDRVNRGGNEEGLLGLAFDPDYASNRHLYVYYSAHGPRRSVLSRFTATNPIADPASEMVILEIPQPFRNHNGGMIAFGPDGMLYVGLGDGGSAGDPDGNGQNPSTLRGSILRIDVRPAAAASPYAVPPGNPFVGVSGARPELWAIGLRNPWRFSFDRATGDLWAGDVGQNAIEEIDLILPGANYGWNVMEGAVCYQRADCDKSGFVPPVATYGHDVGCSVTGGYVYRGSALPTLQGAYLYADYCSGRIWGLRHQGEAVAVQRQLLDAPFQVVSFGEDADGELYVLGFDGGVYRLTGDAVPAAPTPVLAPALGGVPAPTPTPTARLSSPPSPPAPTPTSTPTPMAAAAPSATLGFDVPPPSSSMREGGTSPAVWGLAILALVGAAGGVFAYLAKRGARGAK